MKSKWYVRLLQRVIGVIPDGYYGPQTRTRLREIVYFWRK